ncbi:MAG: hypothetical protein ACK58X_00605 [Planctomycetota bacterium]
MRLLALASLFAGLLAVAVPAQARKPLVGTVVDGDGKPIDGASVECVLAPDGPDLPPVDVLTATTDARGRFRVEALPGALYQCWAAGPKDDGGAQRVSDVVPAAVGQLMALVAKSKGGTGAVTLRGLDAWQDRAPFTLRCVVAGRAVDCKVEAVDGAFVAQVPTRPVGGVTAAVRDCDGFHVCVLTLSPRTTRLSVPSPQPVRCRVVDEKGQPIAGARIVRPRAAGADPFPLVERRIGIAESPLPQEGLLGVTGDDGVVVVRVASQHDLFADKQQGTHELVGFRADAPGRRASRAGRSWQGLFEDGKPAAEKAGRDGFTFTLQPARPQRFRFVEGGKPLAGVAVTAVHAVSVRVGDGFGQSWSEAARATTDDEGRLAIDVGLDDGAQLQLLLATGGSSAAAAGGAACAVRPILLHPQDQRADAGERRIDLAALATVVVTVRDAQGGPGRGAQVALASAASSRQSYDFADLRFLAPDAAGRVAVRLAPGEWCAVACAQDGFVVKEFDAVTTPALELAIAPFPTMRAKVVDDAGKPVVGASFANNGTQTTMMDSKTADWLASRLAWSWNDELIRRARSDADGVLRVPFVPAAGWTQQGVIQLRGKRSAQLDLVAEDVGEVVVK